MYVNRVLFFLEEEGRREGGGDKYIGNEQCVLGIVFFLSFEKEEALLFVEVCVKSNV